MSLITERQIENDLAQILSGDVQDWSVIQAVDSLTPDELKRYGGAIPMDLRHYLCEQVRWLQDSIYFLGIDLGHKPSPDDIALKILNSSHSERYRAYYAMRFPEKIEISIRF